MISTRLPDLVKRMADCWGDDPAFVELGLLDTGLRASDGRHPIDVVWEEAERYKLSLIPVTGLNRPNGFQQAVSRVVSSEGRGVGLRLVRDDLRRANLPEALESFAAQFDLRCDEIDLLVDLGIADFATPSLVYVYSRLPRLEEWRSLTVLSGAFPKDLMGFTVGQHLHPREEWMRWSKEATAPAPSVPRLPTFGDYTIQHAIYYEPPKGANVSASIRYTTDGHWLIMRGEGLRSKGSPGHAQYPANAELLCGSKEYCGPQFSYGDEYIWKVASREILTTGSPETWLRAGINHHLTFVVRQIAGVLG